MLKTNKSQKPYRCTMQQKAINDLLKAYSEQLSTIDLGNCFKLGERGSNLLLDLIKIKKLSEIRFADCTLRQDELEQIKSLLLGQSDKLTLRNNLNLGVEGCALIKVLLRKKSVRCFTAWDCALTQSQFALLLEGLSDMSISEIEEVNLRGNNIGSDGSILLRKFLALKQIKRLDLGHCGLSVSSLNNIQAGLADMKGTMDSLSLRGNLVSRNDVNEFKRKTENKLVEVLFF